ncbi:MAG: transglutaminase domain-containing protein [Clostridia bacterium]|nr:transglutaminase domain-containing protein [Clostridia bacterium]
MKNKLNHKKGVKAKKRTVKPVRKAKKAPKVQPRLPILCRPGAEMSTPLYYIGWVMRSLVLFCGVFGMCLFIGDGLGFYGDGKVGSIPVLALVSLLWTIVCSAAAWNSRTRVIAPLVGIAAGIGSLFAFTSNPFLLIWDGIRCVINNSLLHMTDLGYTSFGNYLIGSRSYFGGDALATNTGFAVLAFILAVLLGLSLLRKVHTFTAVLISVIVIFPVFMYNLTRGNAGVSLVLIFIFGEISLLFYERKFSNYEAKRLERKEAKAAKKQAKKDKKKAKKDKKAELDRTAARAYAIALELTDDKKEARRAKAAVYRLDNEKIKADKKAKKKAAIAEKKKAKADIKADKKKAKAEAKLQKKALAKEKKEFKKLPKEEKARRIAAKKADKKAKDDAAREKRRQRHESETVVRKTLSASGYAGGTAILAAALAVWLPFSAITGNFITIDFINDPVSVAREYVTAYLRGDDIDLNNMGDIAELTPRTLTYDSPEYQQIQMLAVETERAEPVYLRGWIGMRFDTATGTWTSGTTEDVIEYRNEFGKTFNADILKTEILSRMFPTAVTFNDKNPALRFSDYGFDVRQVHLRRINGESLIVYAPPTINSDLGILAYNSLEPNSARYSAYFDSIYSSRFFKKDVNYSTVSFMSKLNDPEVSDGLTGIDKYLDLYMRYIEIYDEALRVLESTSFTGSRDYDTGRGKVHISLSDLTDIDRLFLEECERLGYPKLTGDSLLAKYIAMTPEEKEVEKAELEKFTETEEDYREWAYLHYSSSAYSSAVTEIAKSLLEEAGYVRNTKVGGNTPMYKNKRGADVNQHDVVMTVINYLRDNYTYTLTPTPYTGETEMTVLDSFLTETKNGYCTHFATAAATLIREFGYSVRYCEGYLVNDFARNFADGAPAKYKGFALDESAHAWIEVYYPTLGWVAYETVPEYMEYMYDPIEVEVGDGGEIVDPVPPDEEIELPEENPEETPDEEPEPEVPELPEEPEEPEEEPVDQMLILMIAGIVIGVALIIYFIARFIIKRIMKKAENAVADRHRHIIMAMDTDALRESNVDTLPIAKEFDDTIFRLFKLLGYPPKTGEQHSEYAERLEADFGGMTDYSIAQIFDLVGKVEFGSGLTPEEMYVLADFTDRLTVSAYAGLSRFEKIKYRYIKRII